MTLERNAETVRAKSLRNDLAGFARIRAGDYRVIYEVIHAEKTVVIHFIGHRSEVYKSK